MKNDKGQRTTMKIGIISDLHIPPGGSWSFEPQEDVFYICAGDICECTETRNAFIEAHAGHMFTIKGNHDFYGDSFSKSMNELLETTVDGYQISGATLWTNLSDPIDWIMYTGGLVDKRYIKNLDQIAMCETFVQHKSFLLNSGADIIVSHHTPSLQSVHERFRHSPYNRSFSNDLDEQILSLEKPPKLWIHGHTHESFDYFIGETRVICHPRGYAGERKHYATYEPLIIEL